MNTKFLTDEEIERINTNRQTIIDLLRCVKRDGANIEALINKLDNSDFFRAPASTKYHSHYMGGLAQHVLNVYNNLVDLVKMSGLENIISMESCVIVGILHDFSKMNFYEPTCYNSKSYNENGRNSDFMGRYDWEQTLGWKVIDQDSRFVYGNHEETSAFMIRNYIPLTYEEEAAILHHHGGAGHDSIPSSAGIISSVFNRYPLATLLHLADMLSTYVNESSYIENLNTKANNDE